MYGLKFIVFITVSLMDLGFLFNYSIIRRQLSHRQKLMMKYCTKHTMYVNI